MLVKNNPETIPGKINQHANLPKENALTN